MNEAIIIEEKSQQTIVSEKNQQRYQEAKTNFRSNLEKSYEYMNIMIDILHEENPDWSINRIAKYIWNENKDIFGLSVRSIYNHLNEENRLLIDKRYSPKKVKKNDDDNEQFNVANLQPKIIKQSFVENNCVEYIDDDNEEVKSTQIDLVIHIKQLLHELTGFDVQGYVDSLDDVELENLKSHLAALVVGITLFHKAMEEKKNQQVQLKVKEEEQEYIFDEEDTQEFNGRLKTVMDEVSIEVAEEKR